MGGGAPGRRDVPVTTPSLQLDRALWGERPAGVLLGNAALHAAASAVLFLALVRLTGAVGRSAFVAGVFALRARPSATSTRRCGCGPNSTSPPGGDRLR